MAPKYKLTYFELTGLAESIRFLLSYGGLEFEDVRIAKDQWLAFKPSTPVGQLPTLEIDGKVLYQSVAICRYLAHLVGLIGASPLENWEIDAVADTITDLRYKFGAWFFQLDGEKKEKERATLRDETIPFYLTTLEEIVKKNDGHLALKKLTWVDVFFVALEDMLNEFHLKEFEKPVLSGYPGLDGLKAKVRSIPSIKAWIDKRPSNKFY